MNFVEKLLKEMEKNNVSAIKLAKDIGFNHGAVTDWKKNKAKPSAETVSKIAEYFSVSTDYLLGKTDKPEPIDKWLIENALPVGKLSKLPIYGTVYAGSGYLDEEILGYEIADEHYNDGEHFYLQVKGDSMEPRISEGDLVLVKKQASVDSGTVGVFAVNEEEGIVKKVVYGKDFIELHSFNQKYKVRQFLDDKVLEVRVIGKVVESKRKW